MAHLSDEELDTELDADALLELVNEGDDDVSFSGDFDELDGLDEMSLKVAVGEADRITSYNVCYTKLLRSCISESESSSSAIRSSRLAESSDSSLSAVITSYSIHYTKLYDALRYAG